MVGWVSSRSGWLLELLTELTKNIKRVEDNREMRVVLSKVMSGGLRRKCCGEENDSETDMSCSMPLSLDINVHCFDLGST